METKHYIISGRVQGVGYRWFVSKRAASLGLSGWVRNCRDGSVEVLAQAQLPVLSEFEDMLRKGPPGAYVQDIQSESLPPQNLHGNFDITY